MASANGQGETVSVIVPTYNRSKLLESCLRSVLAQTHRDLEALVVDDGSNDGTRELLLRLASSDPRVKVFTQDRKGAQAARNLGLEQAQGAFVDFLDDDDLWHPDKLATQLQSFRANPKLDGVICQTVWFQSWPGDHNFLFNRVDDRDFLARFLMLDVVWQTAAPLWRRAFIDKVGLWDERLTSGQDLDFHTRCLCYEPRLEILPEPLNFFREHTGTRITKDRKEEHPANALIAMKNAHSLLRARGMMTDERGVALASTVMRQSRTLALYGEAEHVRECLEIALDAHPSAAARMAIRSILSPLVHGILANRNRRPIARALRKLSQLLMVGIGAEKKRISWWQQYPMQDAAAMESWKKSLAPLAAESSSL